jgi:membrane protease YdiL (CAAX protease family)
MTAPFPPLLRQTPPFVHWTRGTTAGDPRAVGAIAAAGAATAALAAWIAMRGWPVLCGPGLRDAGLARWAWAVAVAPLVEETALRAGLHAWLLERAGPAGRGLPPGAANLAVACAFAAAHAGVSSGAVLAAYLLPALWIGLAWERTGRLWPCVAIHASANAAALAACAVG